MSVASIKAGKAFYEIFAEDKTAGGLSSAEQALMKFGARVGMVGASMAAVAAAGLTSITAMVKSFAGAGDDLMDASITTGLSTDFLQSLKFAAADAGVEFNALQAAVGKYASLITDAAAGSASAQATLAKLGLSAEQLVGLSMDDQFKAVADAIARIQDPAQRAAVAIDIFGKSGAKLLPALADGAEGLNAALADMKSRGLILSEADIALAAKANGAFLMLSATISHIVNLIGVAAAPVLLPFMDMLQAGAEAVATFINNNRGLVAGLTIGLGVVGAVGAGLMLLGGAAIAASFATTGLTMAMAGLGIAVGIVTSPFFVITAAIVACGAAALTSAYYLDQLFSNGIYFDAIAKGAVLARDSVQLLWSAIAHGEWQLAGEYIATAIEAAFDGLILKMRKNWLDFTTWMLTSLPGSDEWKAILKQDAEANLADERAAAADSGGRLAKIMGKIAALGNEGGTNSTLSFPSRQTFASASGGLQDIQTHGVLSAAGAARFNQSAPGLQFETLNDTAKGILEVDKEALQLSKQTLEHLRDLKNMTVE